MKTIKNLFGNSSVQNKSTTYINLYSYSIARKNRELFSEFKNIHVDGIALVWILQILGYDVKRKSFDMTSDAKEILAECESTLKTLYIIGSEDGIAEKAKCIFKDKYPNLQILGTHSGFFESNENREKTIGSILNLNPDFLICGMGTPHQEKFIADLSKRGWNGNGYTCGGFLKQTASKGITYYPAFFNKLNLRWLYRVIDEPILLKRYLFIYPLSIFLVIRDHFSLRKKHQGQKS